jgi:hypothetical protein
VRQSTALATQDLHQRVEGAWSLSQVSDALASSEEWSALVRRVEEGEGVMSQVSEGVASLEEWTQRAEQRIVDTHRLVLEEAKSARATREGEGDDRALWRLEADAALRVVQERLEEMGAASEAAAEVARRSEEWRREVGVLREGLERVEGRTKRAWRRQQALLTGQKELTAKVRAAD